MNTQNTHPSAERSRRKAVIVALLVTLIGLTIAPGFKCYHKGADGSESQIELE